MVAPERERPAPAERTSSFSAQRHPVALAEPEPADARGQPLERNPLAGELDPRPQRVGADDLHDDVLAPAQVLRIAGERDPAERADAAREDRPDVRRDEARDRAGLLDPVRGGLGTHAVSVLEDDRAPLAVAEQRLDVRRERVEDGVAEARVVGSASRRLRGRVAARDVAPQRVVGGGLVGDDVELDAVGEEARDDVGRVPDERDHARAVRVEMGGERLVVAGDELDPAVAQAPLGAGGVDLDDQRAAAVSRHGEALRAAHPAEAGGEDAPALQACRRSARPRPRGRSRR